MVGKLAGYRTIWIHPDGIANILSISHLKSKFRVTYDSHGSKQFIVRNSNGADQAFKQSAQGLLYIDMSLQNGMLFNTVGVVQVDNNHFRYSSHDYSKATLARKIQRTIGRPSTKQFICIVNENLLPNCPIKKNDILFAAIIFGEDIGALKDKTTWKKPKSVSLERSPDLLLQYKDVTVAVNIMFVNEVPYLTSTSRHIRFVTAEMIKNVKHETLMTALKQIVNAYKKGRFSVTVILADNQFECTQDGLTLY